MQTWENILFVFTFVIATCLMCNSAHAGIINEKISTKNIVSVTGIAEVYGDGEKISAAILEYPDKIDPKSVSPANFLVEGKTVEAVYVNYKPELTDKNRAGCYVILKFAYENTAKENNLPKKPNNDKNHGKSGTDAPMRSDRKLPDLSFSVKQIGNIKGTNGTIYLDMDNVIESTSTKAPIIESFKQCVYTDENGVSMPYNIYLPEKFNDKKKYPLVVFIADASANINEVTTPLFQGNGATSFSTPEWQKKHECIILAPQYTADLVDKLGMMTTDENVWTPGLTLTSNLIFDVINKYNVDKNRIYGTGQSQGGMANIAISDKYPDLFAAQYLVACQWNVDEMEALKDKNLWITVCQGDEKAFPGMNSAVERWESLGSKVAKNADFWNSKSPIPQLNQQVKTMIKTNPNAKIYYTVFAGGSHMYTWSFAYNIDEIREWLFKQKK